MNEREERQWLKREKRQKKKLRIGESNPGLPGSHLDEEMRADNVSHYTNSDEPSYWLFDVYNCIIGLDKERVVVQTGANWSKQTGRSVVRSY